MISLIKRAPTAWPFGLLVILSGCTAQVRDYVTSDATSSSSSSSSSGSTSSTSGSSSGGVGGSEPGDAGPDADVVPMDPFASGKAAIIHDHSTPITFKLIQNIDPNIWDLTVLNNEFYAVVVSSAVDEVAKVHPSGLVEGLFVTTTSVGPALANDATHFVLDDENKAFYVDSNGMVVSTYATPITGGLRALAGIGRVIYGLGVGTDGEFGVHSLDLDTGATAKSFVIGGGPALPDFLASSATTLITGMVNPAVGCLSLRVHEPSGTLLQELCVAHPFGEVNGMAFDGQLLAISDRTSAMVHYFKVTIAP